MKKQDNNQTKAKSKNQEYFDHAFSGTFGTINSNYSANWLSQVEGPNIFLVRNKGKGPPGQVRSPGVAYCLNPVNPIAAIQSNKTLLITEFQIFKQIQHPNFINN